ncbi:MAG: hypothetical protein R3278_05960 [Lysobacter spongiicola]|nr:hypothetical protein [Lysobacter spongiicola]
MTRSILLMGLWWLAQPAAAQVAEPGFESWGVAVDVSPAPPAVTKWNEQFNAAMSARAAELAAAGTAEGLLAAALIEPPLTDAAAHSSDAPAPVWMQAALDARPTTPLVQWVAASDCPLSPVVECDRERALERLLELDGDNAAVHLMAASFASSAGDEVAARTHLARAAELPRYNNYGSDLFRIIVDARRGASLPRMPDEVVAYHQAADALMASAEDVSAVSSISQWAAQVLPTFTGVMDLCRRDESSLVRDSGLRQDCLGAFAHLAGSDATIIEPLVALRTLVRYSEGAEKGRWKTRLRQVAWLHEQALQLAPGWPGASIESAQYVDWLMEEGELGAYRRVLREHGIPVEPPPGWLPDNPDHRALLSGDA